MNQKCRLTISLILFSILIIHSEVFSQSVDSQQWDTIKWIDSFREFRSAVYQRDINKVKQFIDFPLMNEYNEIWHLAYGGNDLLFDKITSPNKPFTEQDFERHFDNIFSKIFIKTILKVKTDELFQEGYAETIELTDNSTTYSMIVEFDIKSNSFGILFNTSSLIRDEDTDFQDIDEFDILYFFDILMNGQIRLKGVALAG